MAKKKQGSKSKQHTADLVGGMRQSNSQSKTPISSLYPKKFTVGNSRTSPARMQKGTHSPSKSRTPVKLLLAITDPGPRPTAPTAPIHPGASPSALTDPATDLSSGRISYSSYSTESRRWNEGSRSYDDDRRSYDGLVAAKSSRDAEIATYNTNLTNYNRNLSTYNSDLSTHNTNLSNWNTADASRNTRTAQNTTTTNQYQKDLKKFFSNLGKNKNTRKSYNKSRGSRGSNRSTLRGSRG
jgi:hypothetical protein